MINEAMEFLYSTLYFSATVSSIRELSPDHFLFHNA